jgi:gamma-glutamylcyclotransferase (GGCT)/AIG2-like uncharacterized protein YtfP
MDTEFLFVYGTLRKNHISRCHHLFANDWQFIADGYLCGRLYEVAGYPGAIASDNPEERVAGEIYALNNAKNTLVLLDAYEECAGSFPLPHEYVRKSLPICLHNGSPMLAWTYLYNWDVSRLTAIPSGDYLA